MDSLDDLVIDTGDLKSFLENYHHRQNVLKLKRENPYVRGLIEALREHPNGLHRDWVFKALKEKRGASGLPIPVAFEATVQSAYNQHCTDSAVYGRRGAPACDGIFYSPRGKGSGYWGVHRERAAAWLAAKVK